MNKDNYLDIINLPHHTSLKHPRMSIYSRASQFAPFSALIGYDEMVKEASRITSVKKELDDELRMLLDIRLQILFEHIKENPLVTFTYFLQDNNKKGGKYITVTGMIKKIDKVKQDIVLTNSIKIPIKDIINISSNIFLSLE